MGRKLVWLAALLWCGAAFGATISFTLTPAVEYGAPGDTVVFQTVITGGADLFLNDLCVSNDICTNAGSPLDSHLTKDPNFFFANVPGFTPYTGPIFEIHIAQDTPAGIYTGVATVLGGGDFFALDPLASQPFEVVVTPEPGAGWLALAGVAVLFAAGRRWAV